MEEAGVTATFFKPLDARLLFPMGFFIPKEVMKSQLGAIEKADDIIRTVVIKTLRER